MSVQLFYYTNYWFQQGIFGSNTIKQTDPRKHILFDLPRNSRKWNFKLWELQYTVFKLQNSTFISSNALHWGGGGRLPNRRRYIGGRGLQVSFSWQLLFKILKKSLINIISALQIFTQFLRYLFLIFLNIGERKDSKISIEGTFEMCLRFYLIL